VTKSWPRKTPETPSIAKMRDASGETPASSALRKSRVSPGSTSRPGKNFRVAGLGVSSVWMNILAPEPAVQGRGRRLEWFSGPKMGSHTLCVKVFGDPSVLYGGLNGGGPVRHTLLPSDAIKGG